MNPDPGMMDNLVIPCFHCAAVSLSHVVGLSILCLLFSFLLDISLVDVDENIVRQCEGHLKERPFLSA